MPDVVVNIDQGYPQDIIQRPDDGGWEYTLALYIASDVDSSVASFPALGATESVWGGIENAKVLTRSFSAWREGKWWTRCVLKCGTAGESWVPAIDEGALEKPLSMHPNFKASWLYHLAMKKGTSSYSSFSTATDIALTEANAAIVKWVREPAEVPIDSTNGPWKIPSGYTKTKPGVEAYISPAPTIRLFKRFTSFAEALASKLTYPVGAHKEPTFPYLGGTYSIFTGSNSVTEGDTETVTPTGSFMVNGSTLQFDGAYWIHNLSVQLACWDTDVYGATTGAIE